MENLKELCVRYEHYITPKWAAEAILKKEILTPIVLDPCCGTGVLSEAALKAGHQPYAIDVFHWGYRAQNHTIDFLEMEKFFCKDEFSVFMNPPFTKACEFVLKAKQLGARKILCFQRMAWFESAKRRQFWDKNPPARIYICGDRASCWRADIPEENQGSNTPTAHAWFVWEKGFLGNPTIHRLYKKD